MKVKIIPGFSSYEISEDGETIRRIKGGQGTRAGHVMKPCLNQDGYKKVTLVNDGGKIKGLLVHRLVAAAFIGDPTGLDINHKDGIKTNNTVQNLEIVSHQENMTHSIEVLGIKYGGIGERNRHAKLKESDISVIRERLSRGETQKSIADDYGVVQQTISNICTGKLWKHIDRVWRK